MKARDGDIVRVRYILSLNDGPVYGSSTEPLLFEFMIGRGTVLPAFENAVVGMREGEVKKITAPPEKPFAAGMKPHDCTDEGAEIIGRVTEVDDPTLKIDANQEVAGKALLFEIRLLKIIRPC